MLFVKAKIVVDLSEIKAILEEGLETENRVYLLKDAYRINESYISINIK